MKSGSSKPRPSIASALERVLRDVQPARPLPDQDEPASGRAKSGYFAPGDNARESDWWQKQLAGRGHTASAR